MLGLPSVLALGGSRCRTPAGPDGTVREVWLAPQSGRTRSRPVVAGDVVFFADGDGAIVARDVATGNARWSTKVATPGTIEGAELVTGGDVVLAQSIRETIALRRSDGVERWRYSAPLDTTYDGNPGVVQATHAVADATTAYIPAWGASVSAVDLTTASPRWKWHFGRVSSDTAANVFRSGATGVAIAGDTVFAAVWHDRDVSSGGRDAFLVALDRQNGRELSRVALPRGTNGSVSVSAAPLVFTDVVVVATVYGYVYGVNRTSLEIAWTFRSAQFVFATLSQPAAMGDVLYIDGGDERLYALDAHNGAVLWTVASVGAFRDLFATSRRVYVTNGHSLLVHDRADGHNVATVTLPVDGEIMTTAAAARGDQIFITRSFGAWSFREP